MHTDRLTLVEGLEAAAAGLTRVDVATIAEDVALAAPERAGRTELRRLAVDSALQRAHEHPDHAVLAARLFLEDLRREAVGCPRPSTRDYRAGFVDFVTSGIRAGLLDERLGRLDLGRLAGALQPARDGLLGFNGLFTLYQRYLVRDHSAGRVLELPQYMWMRVAAGVSLAERDPEHSALEFYEHMSRLLYVPSTPTLFNAGTPCPQLSSCFVMEVGDSMEDIGTALVRIMQLAKYAGGIGASVTRLRAAGSVIRSVNGRSSGPVPFIKMMDAVISGVDQGGRRRGTLAVYMEPWHLDVERFIDLRQRAGDERQRVHTLNPVLFLNDEFLRRVEADGDWHLFDPRETPELADLYGEDFTRAYRRCEERALAGELEMHRRIRARTLFRRILKSLVETSHPWLTFKDPGNLRCPIRHCGTVHSSNLCTEIFLPTDRDNIAVCNLASVVLPRHADPSGKLDLGALARTVRVAVRHLDDVIDVNFYALPEARRANRATRPVGLGFMGWADLLARRGVPLDSPQAEELLDEVSEFVSHRAIAASCELAGERGRFPEFAGSDWERGLVPCDTLAALGGRRSVPGRARLDWETLRRRVRRGMRNGTVMAVAPTATISLIAGTSQSIEPRLAPVHTRNNISGKFLEVDPELVRRLEVAGLWDEVRDELVLARGEVSQLERIPSDLRRLFRGAFELDQRALLRQAAVVQRWADQGVSRNLYLTTRSPGELEELYLEAFRLGLKATYYAYVRPAMRAEATWAYDHHRPRAHLEQGLGTTCEVCQ